VKHFLINNINLDNLINDPNLISDLDISIFSEIIKQAIKHFRNENKLIELRVDNNDDEIFVIGDIHGNLDSLLNFLKIIRSNNPKYIIFLGDIVDRGPKQLECLIIILSLKIKNPERFYLLRGNHESYEMNKAYGFYEEFIRKFCDYDRYNEIEELYDSIPVCALVNEKILCVHGGIPEDIDILNNLKNLNIITYSKEKSMMILKNVFQMMWNDPKPLIKGFQDSIRGIDIKYFGKDVFDEFMNKNNLDFLIRSHEVFQEGYRFFFKDRLLSIFSSSNYRGKQFPNPASYAIIKGTRVLAKIL